jgi:ribosome-associated toxin RatA of RatAB toxin-antitoxin module
MFGFGRRNKDSDSDGSASDDDTFEGVNGEMVVDNVSVDDCANVIIDYEKYPNFMPLFQSVKILSKTLDPQTGDLNETVVYNIHTTFKDVSYTLKLRIHRSGPNHISIKWDSVSGPFLYNKGGWELVQVGNGVQAKYSLDMKLNFYVPKTIKKIVLGKVLKDTMNSMKHEIQTNSANHASQSIA